MTPLPVEGTFFAETYRSDAAAPDGLELKLDFDQSTFVRAAINGVCAGGGFVLAMMCDVRFANQDDWDSLDPADTYYAYAWDFARLYGRSLVMFKSAPGADGATLVPDLAESLGKSSDDAKTIPVGLSQFIGENIIRWDFLTAGGVLAAIPILIGFMYAQRGLISGLASGAVKG